MDMVADGAFHQCCAAYTADDLTAGDRITGVARIIEVGDVEKTHTGAGENAETAPVAENNVPKQNDEPLDE